MKLPDNKAIKRFKTILKRNGFAPLKKVDERGRLVEVFGKQK